MRIHKTSGEGDLPETSIATLGQHPTKIMTFSIFYNDNVASESEITCSLTINFITPVDDESKEIDSIFTLNQILFGASVMDVVTKFIQGYGQLGFFDNCDIADQIYVSYIDGSDSTDFSVMDLIAKAKKDPQFSHRIEGTPFGKPKDGIKYMTPRLVKR